MCIRDRHYSIKEAAGDGRSDDVASIAEVTRRRFWRHVQDSVPPSDRVAPEAAVDAGAGARRPARFAYPPNLYVIDGGAPQVNAAAAALKELGVVDVAVIGLAKRLEEVWVPNLDGSAPDPIIFPRNSEGLYLLQRVRDEAHRFAITSHRQRRGKAGLASQLEDVPGIGPQRRKALLKAFERDIEAIRAASIEELTAVPGITREIAENLKAALGG